MRTDCVCPPSPHPHIHMLKPCPQGMLGLWEGIRVGGGPEGGALAQGLCPYEKRQQTALSPQAHREVVAIHESEGRPHGKLALWHLDLGLPASRAVRSKSLLFKPPSHLWGLVT